MKKRIICTIICLTVFILFFTQCTNKNNQNYGSLDNESRYYSVISSMYNNEITIAFFEFSEIIDLLINAEDTDDIIYLNGRVEGYLSNGTFIDSLVQDNITYTQAPIIDPDFKELIFDVVKSMTAI